jgi:hypothetical protein
MWGQVCFGGNVGAFNVSVIDGDGGGGRDKESERGTQTLREHKIHDFIFSTSSCVCAC